jgi:hypothetical protein
MITGNIDIDPTFWGRSSEIEKRALIYHEIAHCLWIRFHRNSLDDDKCPISLMHYTIPDYLCLQRKWKHYIIELFGGE